MRERSQVPGIRTGIPLGLLSRPPLYLNAHSSQHIQRPQEDLRLLDLERDLVSEAGGARDSRESLDVYLK